LGSAVGGQRVAAVVRAACPDGDAQLAGHLGQVRAGDAEFLGDLFERAPLGLELLAKPFGFDRV
jgi:hypothetical protein